MYAYLLTQFHELIPGYQVPIPKDHCHRDIINISLGILEEVNGDKLS